LKRAALALGLFTACAHVGARPPGPQVAISGTPLSVESESGDDRDDLSSLIAAAAEALPEIERWGGLRAPTRIIVVPDHAALEERTHHHGYDWLRAWARYDVVYLQSPRTWHMLGIRPSRDELRAILVHELTHCTMYQTISDGRDWDQRNVPLWFREGMASWTAHQADRRLSERDLSRFLARHPAVDPLGEADALYQHDEALVYSAGHWAFDRLAGLGTDRVNALLKAMRAGRSFSEAFQGAFGETPEGFEAQALRAWRGASGST